MSALGAPLRLLVCWLALALPTVSIAIVVDDASAAGETCHGQPATLVGTRGGEIHGTDGPDVVVTHGATQTSTGSGDDLVCVTGGSGLPDADVSAGDGDDVVNATASRAWAARVFLDTGDDTFLGGDQVDVVYADEPGESPPGQGDDTVTTGAGDDLVTTGGSLNDPDRDAIDLGPGRDDAWVQGAVDPALPIEGGDGADLLEFDGTTLRHALTVDNAVGEATDAGLAAMTWSGMERFSLSPIGPWEAPAFVGGPGDEKLWSGIPLTSVRLGGGNDLANLELQRQVVDHASYFGGGGSDSFILYAGAGDMARRVRLDIPEGRLLFRRASETVHARIHGFERDRFSARRLDVIGSAGADHLQWLGCRGVVAGGRGDDLIEAMSDSDAGCGYLGDDAQLVVRGGPGDDNLVGNYFPDTLLGGKGDDVARGGRNQDRCVAETTISCERLS